jgi:hypothetical protein
MLLGNRMRTLWQQRAGVVASALLALLAALSSVGDVRLVPPGFTPRSLAMASASTHVLIDTPRSALFDRRQDISSLQGLSDRALLLGNIIAREPVRAFIAKRAGVPLDSLQITPPLTPRQPRAPADADTQKHASDVVRSNDEYRLSIESNPTVPLLDIYAQTDDAGGAALLANAAVDGLRNYLDELARASRTPADAQIKLVQLGRARGETINRGVGVQVAVLTFLLVFALASATVVFLARIRQGWRLAVLTERSAGG